MARELDPDEISDEAHLLAIQRLDNKSVQLQKQGKYAEAVHYMESALLQRQEFFGSDSEEVWQACRALGELCNVLAMSFLQQDNFKRTEQLLRKAEILHQKNDAGRAVTYNNFACLYRRKGKLRDALTFLKKTLRLEGALDNEVVKHRGDTHLNLCAVLSQLGRHDEALEHSQAALILLQEELFTRHSTEKGPTADRIAVLAIAYHTVGVENEYLKQFAMAVESYSKGVELSEAHLGKHHNVSTTLRNSLVAATTAANTRTLPRLGHS